MTVYIIYTCLYIFLFSELYQAVRQTVEYVKEQLKSYKGGGKICQILKTQYIYWEKEKEWRNMFEITKDKIFMSNPMR